MRASLYDLGCGAADSSEEGFNRTIDRRPALVVRCAGMADVIAAVRFAHEHDLVVATRGGCHSVAGNAVCDAGVLMDLSPMKGVHVGWAPPTRSTSSSRGAASTPPRPSASAS